MVTWGGEEWGRGLYIVFCVLWFRVLSVMGVGVFYDRVFESIVYVVCVVDVDVEFRVSRCTLYILFVLD